MKTQAEYLKENKIIHYLIAEINEAADEAEKEWQNWEDIIDQERVNRILREMYTGAIVADGKCTEFESKKYIDNLVKQHQQKEQRTMEKNSIKVGERYPVKVGKNQIEVTVIKQTAKGWIVETAKGKTFPVNDPARFVRTTDGDNTASNSALQATEAEESSTSRAKLSMINAAIEILKDATSPMNCSELVAEMETCSLWISPGGKTPAKTLSAAIQREIKTKKNPRFRKAASGTYELAKGATNA